MSDLMLFGVLKMPYDMAMGDELSRRQFYDRAQQALAMIEELRRDAQRYRWLRDESSRHSDTNGSPTPWIVFGTCPADATLYYEQNLDAAIDAARGAEVEG